jgi:hypothetical protein
MDDRTQIAQMLGNGGAPLQQSRAQVAAQPIPNDLGNTGVPGNDTIEIDGEMFPRIPKPEGMSGYDYIYDYDGWGESPELMAVFKQAHEVFRDTGDPVAAHEVAHAPFAQ